MLMRPNRFFYKIFKDKVTSKKQFVTNNQLLGLKMLCNLAAPFTEQQWVYIMFCWPHVCSVYHRSYSDSHNNHQPWGYKSEHNTVGACKLLSSLFKMKLLSANPLLFDPCYSYGLCACFVRTDCQYYSFLELCHFFYIQQSNKHLQYSALDEVAKN